MNHHPQKTYRHYLKKQYLWLLVPLLLLVVFLYHFFAANQAERDLDSTLQQLAEESAAGIQYSDIEIGPYSGEITFEDLNLFVGRHVERSAEVRFHLGYLTFLRLYIGDMAYALDRPLEATVRLTGGSYRDRVSGREFSADTLRITYRGNGWQLIQHLAQGRPLGDPQQMDITGRGVSGSAPDAPWGAVAADTLRYAQQITEGDPISWLGESPRLELRGLTWKPPSRFREQYRFFIRGFNYPVDAVPLQALNLEVQYDRTTDLLRLIEAELRTDHFLLELQGTARVRDSLAATPLDSLRLRVTDYSDQFRSVLRNLGQLFQVRMPVGQDSLSLPLQGTLQNPSVRLPVRN